MPIVIWKEVKMKRYKAPEIQGAILSVLNKYGEAILRDYQSTASTWENPADIPSFKLARFYSKYQPRIEIDIYNGTTWERLEGGTTKRWAVMSSDFGRKTYQGYIGSLSGQGRVVIRGRRAMKKRHIPPRPGIQARNWTFAIRNKYEDSFRRTLISTIRNNLHTLLWRENVAKVLGGGGTFKR